MSSASSIASPTNSATGRSKLVFPYSRAPRSSRCRSWTTKASKSASSETIAAWQALAEKVDLAFEELLRLAVFRLEVERELGAQLAQVVRSGPRRKLSPGMTNSTDGIPDGITRNQSAAYQKLAAIPEEVFRGYVEKSREIRKVPSSAGARRFARPSTPRRASPRKRPVPAIIPDALLEACVRCLGDIDVLVGNTKVKASKRAAGLSGLATAARGSVLVADGVDAADELSTVARLWLSGRINEAIVALPRDIDASWWATVRPGPWSLCIPPDRGAPIIAHIGGRAHGFALVFAAFGVVVDVRAQVTGKARA